MSDLFNDKEIDIQRRYKCKIRESGRYEEYYSVDLDYYDFNGVTHSDKCKTERIPILEISITRTELDRLKTDLKEVETYRRSAIEVNAAYVFQVQKNKAERERRERNPAAAKAYEKYLLLLNMTADANGTS